jgi:cohesin complex subunit SCC1
LPKAKRPRLLQADDELELPDDQFLAPRGNSAILGQERYIPSDPALALMRAIEADPNAHFLPTRNINGRSMFYAGPEGLAPELENLFTFPSDILRKHREASMTEEERANKRPRIQSEEDLEIARRGSILPPSEGGFALDPFNPDETIDFPPFQEDIPFQPDENELITPRAKRVRQEREPSIAPSRAESIARHVQYDEVDPDHPLGMFDPRIQAERESLMETPQKSSLGGGGTEISRTTGGYSKNTGMAMGLLRREIEAIEEEDKVVRFEKLANKVGCVLYR